jgi:hypothetical protein
MCTYWGWPLLIVLAGCVGYLWRSQTFVRAAVPVGIILFWLSLGPVITIKRMPTGFPALYRLLQEVPVINAALPVRYALPLIPLVGAVLACAVHQALTSQGLDRYLVPAAVCAALLPLTPLPLPTTKLPPVPKFFADGYWRKCVLPGGVLVPVPLPGWSKLDVVNVDALRWAAAAGDQFRVPEGYFLGPYGGPGNKPSIGVYSEPTSQLLDKVRSTGVVPPIGEAERAQARKDIAHWGASCVALGPTVHRDQLKQTLDQLYGPGALIADVWVWRGGG